MYNPDRMRQRLRHIAEHRPLKSVIAARLNLVHSEAHHSDGVDAFEKVYHLSAYGSTWEVFFRENHTRPVTIRIYKAIRRRLLTAYHGDGLGCTMIASDVGARSIYGDREE